MNNKTENDAKKTAARSFRASLKLGMVDAEGRGKVNAVTVGIRYTAPGQVDECGNDRPDGDISMSGSVWNSRRSDIVRGGQCEDAIREYFPASADVQRLCDLWDRWHMSGTRAGCEHQRAAGLASKPLVLVDYMLNTDIWQRQNAVKDAIIKAAARGQSIKLAPAGAELLALALSFTGPELPAASPLLEKYAEKKRETKLAGWVYPKEHADGQLCRPCPVCGYKYGSKWLAEKIPADVVAELLDLARIFGAVVNYK